MKERPILFSAPMVKAILAGNKTQTRRIVKDEAVEGATARGCPYGTTGDRLWVKETFFDARLFKHEPLFAAMKLDYIYRADYDYREGKREPSVIADHHWKPSIFMPRAASRITLEITGVRVERLQDISEDDAKAEGFIPMKIGGTPQSAIGGETYRDGYAYLWDGINGVGAWAKNPWVWVIAFKKLEATQ